MNRFALSEMSMERLTSAMTRRVHDLPHMLAWELPCAFARQNRKRLSQFSNKHAGQRCFILANGPSLARIDLSPLRTEITFGLNRIYLLFDKLGFGCTYYVSVNELVLRQFTADIAGLPMPKFISWNLRSLFDVTEGNAMFVRVDLNLVDKFARNVSRLVYSGGTVTYVALQLAYFMGFTEVVLVGLDHSFVDTGMPNKVVTRRQEIDENHFDPQYFPKGSQWQLPDLRRSAIAYRKARQVFERNGRRILDATLDGNCREFEKVDFYSMFDGARR